jgi:hypothetical protein
MPINPNIALGVRPIEQPNMLGQYAQVMALRQAQQEYENEGGLRRDLSQGVPEDPTKLLQYGPKGRAAYESLLKGRKEKLESDDKRNVMLGGLAGPVMENPTPQNFNFALDRAVNYGLMTPTQKQEVLAQYGNNPESIKSYAAQIFKGSITAQAQQADATSRANNAATVGASYYSSNTAAQTAANRLDFDRNRRNVIAGDNQYYTTGAFGDVQPVTGYGTSAPALPPAAANAFVTAKPSVNAFAPTAPVSQPGAPTVANAAAITAQQNVPRPPARAGYKYNEQGQLVKVPDEKPVWNDKAQVWMTPPTAENPQGTVTEAPAVQKAVQERTANATLKVAGYNPKTQTDEVSSLIKESTSGLAENWANKVWSAISGTGSKGAEAIAKLETRANEMTLALAPNGSLGAGFSNEDRIFMLGKLGDVANPDKPMNVRLAAWEDVMERTARTAGVPYTKQSFGSSSAGGAKTVTKTGTFNGRKVVQYSDGTTAYAD